MLDPDAMLGNELAHDLAAAQTPWPHGNHGPLT
jgi:hypothetical protein